MGTSLQGLHIKSVSDSWLFSLSERYERREMWKNRKSPVHVAPDEPLQSLQTSQFVEKSLSWVKLVKKGRKSQLSWYLIYYIIFLRYIMFTVCIISVWYLMFTVLNIFSSKDKVHESFLIKLLTQASRP